jgi:hypothetical protein
VVDDAESRREAGLLPVFSLDPGYNSFHVSSPDVTCSLSFTAKNASLSDQLALTELPSTELPKLDGPATIDGDTLQVTVHNGTSWELREVVIGLTIVGSRNSTVPPSGNANTKAGPLPSNAAPDPFQKQPDTTILLHVKGSAAPAATAIFRTSLNFALFPDQEWHWAIVKAKGIPPQVAPLATTASTSETVSVPQQTSPPLSLQPNQNDMVGIAPATATSTNAGAQPQ